MEYEIPMLIVIDLGFVRMMDGFSLLLYLLLPCGMLLAEASIMSSPSSPSHTDYLLVRPYSYPRSRRVEVLANLEGSKGMVRF